MNEPIIISIGGGKGGVGKSTIAANLGAALSRKGFTVGFIDADLGGANLHTCVGVKRPAQGLKNFMEGAAKSLAGVSVSTPVPNSWLISGASDFLELANPNYSQKQKIINGIMKMQADYILVDLGAGSDYHVTDFYAAFPHSVVVTDGLPTSIENAYGFLKSGIFRGLQRLLPGRNDIQRQIAAFTVTKSGQRAATMEEMLNGLGSRHPEEVAYMREWLESRKTFLVLNMVRGNEEIAVGQRFTEIVKKYLSVNLCYIGYMLYTPEIRVSLRAMRSSILADNPKVTECFEAISRNLLAVTRGK